MTAWVDTSEAVRGLVSPTPRATTAPSEPGRFDRLLAAVVLAAFTAPGMMFLGVSDNPNAPPTPALRLYWPPVYLLTLVLLGRRWRPLRGCWPAALMIAAPTLWAWASQFWSIVPEDSSRRGLAVVLTTVFGFALGGGFSGRDAVRITSKAMLWLAVGSALIAVLLPRYGVEQVVNQGCWRGLWDTKNALAAFMSLGAVAAACAASLPGPERRLHLAAFAVCTLDLLMSRGKTALVCYLVSLAMLAVWQVGRLGPVWGVLTTWAAGTAVLFGGLIALAAPEMFFKAIGKDATLTGRTQIWASVLHQVAERPIGGFGFGAFWDKHAAPAKIVARETGWPAPEAHNGWLDLLAQVGWVGAVLTGLCCALALGLSVVRARGRDDGLFAPIYVVSFLGLSLAESVLLSANSLTWVIFVAAFAGLASRPWAQREGREMRLAPTQSPNRGS